MMKILRIGLSGTGKLARDLGRVLHQDYVPAARLVDRHRVGRHRAPGDFVLVCNDLKRLDGRVARLEHGQAKLEGLLEGLREAITRRSVA